MSGFAAIWWWMSLACSGQQLALAFIGPAVSLVVILFAHRRLRNAPALDVSERKRIGRVVGWAAMGEGFAIFVAFNILQNLGLVDYFVPVIALIVGLHFLPLAAFLKIRIYWASAASLILVG